MLIKKSIKRIRACCLDMFMNMKAIFVLSS